MGAALRISRSQQVQYSRFDFKKVRPSTLLDNLQHFMVTFDTSELPEEEQSCWLPIFTNPIIAQGFPIPVRAHGEQGLEIPLEMMAALGGARHAVDFGGGLMLKGYSTLFVPTRRYEDSIQWHLICERNGERISYREGSAQCPNRLLLEDLNHEELKNTRAYLGWWKEAETHLATADADYESIDWSKAKVAGPSLRFTGGTLGVSKIITAQVNFVLGVKDGPFHYSQQGPFQKTINRAERIPVVLYDQKDRRAWLVPALPVILHIIQLKNHIRPFIVGGNKVEISPLDPSRNGYAAREAVDKNKSQKLYDRETNEDDQDYCFRDAILDTWSILDRLMEREATTQATPGMTVHASRQNILYGWEFRDVADDESNFKQKAQVLKKTAGRWRHLVKDVDAIVLFGSGFGDIIKPTPESPRLCQRWRCLPKEKDYLAACVPMLETFYAKAGHRLDHQYLTSAKLVWHRGSMLFEQCAEDTSECCKCDRLQQVSYHVFDHNRPPGTLEANGCVVFGHAHYSWSRLQNRWLQSQVL